MRTKDKKTLHTKDVQELIKILSEAKKALADFQLDHMQNKLKNTSSLPNKRREIAQIQTVLQAKEKEENLKREDTPKI